MDVELALRINRLVHNECKDVPHDIGLIIEELVRLHQSELKNCSIPVVSNCTHDNTSFKHIRCNVCDDCGDVIEIDV